jgi:TolB-like protein
MKKAIKALFALLFVIFTVSGALAAEKKDKPEIKTVDNYVAVFDFEVTTGDKGISRPLADSVIHEFSQSDKYEVIDRGNMNKILGEQKFQMSGCVAQECKVEAGQILGVGKIVNGSVGIVGKTYYLTLQLINVQTGKIEISVADKCRCELDELLDSTTRLAKKLLGEKVEQPAATAPKPATVDVTKQPEPKPVSTPIAIVPPAAPAKETARDGRFIAYDNGTVMDTRTNLMWAERDNGSNINWQGAKSYCENYQGGGYTDWRMPTQDELAGLYYAGKTYQSECRGLFGGTWNIHLTELIRLTCILAWASETRGSYAAFFRFDAGERNSTRQSGDASCCLALPVRSGK